jgi:hypothetical protein
MIDDRGRSEHEYPEAGDGEQIEPIPLPPSITLRPISDNVV